MKNSETSADGSGSAVTAPKRRRLYRAIVELPPRLLGTIVPEPAPGWMPRPAWNAPLTIARLPTLIAGGDFIAGELTTRGTVPAVETWIYDHDAIDDQPGARQVHASPTTLGAAWLMPHRPPVWADTSSTTVTSHRASKSASTATGTSPRVCEPSSMSE